MCAKTAALVGPERFEVDAPAGAPGPSGSAGRRHGRPVGTAARRRCPGACVRAPGRAACRARSRFAPVHSVDDAGRLGVDHGDAAVGPVVEAQRALVTGAASGGLMAHARQAHRRDRKDAGNDQAHKRRRSATRGMLRRWSRSSLSPRAEQAAGPTHRGDRRPPRARRGAAPWPVRSSARRRAPGSRHRRAGSPPPPRHRHAAQHRLGRA